MHHQRGIRDCDNGYDLVERDGKKTCMKFIRESQDRYKNPIFNFFPKDHLNFYSS